MRSNVQLDKIKKDLEQNSEITKCARQCGVIGDQTKLKICYILRNYPELNVTQIANLVGSSVSNVSHSLARLKDVELLCVKTAGKNHLYSLNKPEFKKVAKLIRF
jgi:ArsR family transcriptional regulator, lead/cadmium/zinc/bismuth-responsive transcriptional repressor